MYNISSFIKYGAPPTKNYIIIIRHKRFISLSLGMEPNGSGLVISVGLGLLKAREKCLVGPQPFIAMFLKFIETKVQKSHMSLLIPRIE